VSKPKESLFIYDDSKEARIEFINAERREVIRDLRLVLGIVIGIQSTLVFVSLVYKSPMGSPLNRIVYSLFLFSPWIVLYFIWSWNQNYYFDALGIRMILVELIFIEFLSMGLLVFEIVGGGTSIPYFINDTISLTIYVALFLAFVVLNVFLVYLLIQTEERPYFPLVKNGGKKYSSHKHEEFMLSQKEEEKTPEISKEKKEGKTSQEIDSTVEQSVTESVSIPSRPSIIKELKQPKKKSNKSGSSKSRKKTSSNSKSNSKKKS